MTNTVKREYMRRAGPCQPSAWCARVASEHLQKAETGAAAEARRRTVYLVLKSQPSSPMRTQCNTCGWGSFWRQTLSVTVATLRRKRMWGMSLGRKSCSIWQRKHHAAQPAPWTAQRQDLQHGFGRYVGAGPAPRTVLVFEAQRQPECAVSARARGTQEFGGLSRYRDLLSRVAFGR